MRIITVFIVLMLLSDALIGQNIKALDRTKFGNKRPLHELFTEKKLKEESSQDNKLKLDSLVEYKFDDNTESWDTKRKKIVYKYDIEGNEIEAIYYSWRNEDEQWFPFMKEESSYNSSNLLENYIYYVYTNNNEWNSIFKEEYTYNSDKGILESKSYSWSSTNASWAYTWRWEYDYDVEGKPISETLYEQMSDGSWKKMRLLSYDYAENSVVEERWKTGGEKYWFKKTVYRFSNHKLIAENIYRKEAEEAEWIPDQQFLFIRKGEKLSQKIERKKDKDSEKWVIQTRIEYNHDDEFNFGDLVLPWLISTQEEMYFEYLLSSYIESAYEEEEYKPQLKTQYYYSDFDFTSNINQLQYKELKVYPVPAKDVVYIDNVTGSKQGRFELINMAGQTVFSTTIESNAIDINQIVNGIYSYRIILGKQVYSGSLIKE